MRHCYKQFVQRKGDRGHREVGLIIDFDGLPFFAASVIPLYLFQLVLDEMVWNQQDPIEEFYVLYAREVLEEILSP